jgi:hypothetical protein
MKASGHVLMTAQPGAWLARQLTCICRCAAGDLERLPTTPEHSVHALRVRMKKLRSLLRLVEPHLSRRERERLRRRIRGIKNTFTGTREATVLRKLARRLRERHSLPPVHLASAAVEHDPRAPDPLPSLKRKLATLRRDLATLPLASLTITDVIESCVDRYRTCRRLMKQCARRQRDDDFHRWRQRVKECHYLSLAFHALPTARSLIRPTERLGHLLGEEHDLTVLASRLTGPSGQKWRARIEKDLTRQRRRILAEAPAMLAIAPRKLLRRMNREAAELAASP